MLRILTIILQFSNTGEYGELVVYKNIMYVTVIQLYNHTGLQQPSRTWPQSIIKAMAGVNG